MTSLVKEVMFWEAFVCCLSVFLSVSLSVYLVTNITQKLWMDCNEILCKGPRWQQEQVIRFW